MRKLNSILMLSILLLFMCNEQRSVQPPPMVIPPDSAMDSILQTNRVQISTQYSTTAFYVYQGYSRGFHYDLVNSFSNYLQVKPDIVQINNNTVDAIEKLNNREFDLYAATVTHTDERMKKVLFSEPLFFTDMVLVQRKKSKLITKPEELDGAEIVVLKNSLAQQMMRHIADSLQINVTFDVLAEDGSTEDMLNKVESALADYTIVDSHIARTMGYSMNNIHPSLVLASDLPVSWAIDPYSPDLRDEINRWIRQIKSDGTLDKLYGKYFDNRSLNQTNKRKYISLSKGILSPYDDLIKRESKRLNWDWRLLASLIYTESNFNPDALSEKQAYGLMQVLEETALTFNVSDFTIPANNLRAGVNYLLFLDNVFSKFPIDSTEKIKFMLAGYNAGAGHVRDAQRLAEKYGRDPYVWDGNVDHFILHKREPRFYRDSVSLYGYCDGKQVYNYVNKVMNTYGAYKHIKE